MAIRGEAGGRRLSPGELKEVAASIRVLGGRAKSPKVREQLHTKTTEEMIAKLGKFPELKEALAALEKG